MRTEHSLNALTMIRWGESSTELLPARLEVTRSGGLRTLSLVIEGAGLDLRIEDGVPSGRVQLGDRELSAARSFEVTTIVATVNGTEMSGTRVQLRALDRSGGGRLVPALDVDVVVLEEELAEWLALEPDPPADLDEEAFTELFVELLRERLPDVEVTVTAPLTVAFGAPDQRLISLQNLWRSRPDGQRALAKELIRFARVLLLTDRSDGLIDQVLPVLRHPNLFSRLQGAARPLLRPFAADIVNAYVFDLPERMRFVMESDMEPLGIDPAELHSRALANLSRVVPEVERHGAAAAGRFMLVCGGDYEASTLLFPEVWEALAQTLGAEPVVVVAARDLVLVAGKGDLEGRARNREIAAEVAESGSYAISTAELLWRAGVWSVAASPAAAPVEALSPAASVPATVPPAAFARLWAWLRALFR